MAHNSSNVCAFDSYAGKFLLLHLERTSFFSHWKICFPLFQISFDLKNLSLQIIFENQKCTALTTFLNDPFKVGYCICLHVIICQLAPISWLRNP